ncbi:MAG: molybdenum ABC transporter ATP-binding protein [Pseudomonadota bacterium]
MMKLALDLNTDYGAFLLRARGEFALDGITALFGPSGAGKSTVLNAIAGFRPGIGTVEVNNAVWQNTTDFVPPHRRSIGMVFQSGRLFAHMSVAGNLRYAERRAQDDGQRISRKMVIDALGIGPLLSQSAGTLSGGEVQRVAIARALMTKPKLMLMDEPLAALDRKAKADLLGLIASLPELFDIPVLFVSHQLEEITQIASGLIAMRDGHIIDHGPLEKMLETLDPMVTGRFEAGALIVGEAGRFDTEYAMQAIELGAGRLWLPMRTQMPVGTAVRVRLRARDVSIALQPIQGLSIRNQIPAQIINIESEEGSFAEVVLRCDGQTLRARTTRKSVAELSLQPGMEVIALVKSVAFDRRLQ